MHRTYLADIERGARNVTLRSVGNLARALEVSVATLLVGAEPLRSPVGPPCGPGEILLVEDEATDAELTRRAFRRARITNPIKVVRDGRQALDYLFCRGRFAKRHPVNPELLLLDLQLPGLSGLEVLREIKAGPQTRGIPVVILTSSRDDRSILDCARLGVSQYLLKPVEFESISKVTPKLNLHWTLARPGSGHRAALER